jgi:hypothetical protein
MRQRNVSSDVRILADPPPVDSSLAAGADGTGLAAACRRVKRLSGISLESLPIGILYAEAACKTGEEGAFCIGR